MAVAVSGGVPSLGRVLSARAVRSRLVHSPVVRALVLAIVAGGMAVSSYLTLLGWGRRTATGVNAYLSSPWRGWQISVLMLVLGVLAAAAGWVGHPIVGSLALSTAITACWTLDAALNVRGDRNWPIGMTLVGWASFGATFVLSGLVAESRRVVRQRAEDAALAARHVADLQEAEQARLRAAARVEVARVEAARVAAERPAPLAATPDELELTIARRAKVVQAFRTSAAKVRSSAPKGRANAS